MKYYIVINNKVLEASEKEWNNFLQESLHNVVNDEYELKANASTNKSQYYYFETYLTKKHIILIKEN